jgi:DNA-binding NarL/FixJ family response regulator
MKILLVEDHALFRDGVTLLISQLSDEITCIGCEDAGSAIDVAQTQALDLVLLDYNLPDMTGLKCLLQIRACQPDLRVIMLSAEQGSELIKSAFTHGAKGFITKNSPSKVMLSAIQLVLAGGIYVPPEMLMSTADVPTPSKVTIETSLPRGVLTERQHDVFEEMKKGLSNKEIARALNMSPSTVKVHVAAILREFNVKNRTQAVNMDSQNPSQQ